jgi:hypothetical protein
MERRAALKYTAAILGGSILGAEVFLSGCKLEPAPADLFSAEDIQLLDEIGETILPDSDRSPGAKAAEIGSFMQTIVRDCYAENERTIFIAGLAEVRQAAREKYAADFLALSLPQRTALLTEFDQIARSSTAGEATHFFSMLKQLTIWGYFSSEVGATQAMRYLPTPGEYVGCVDYQVGDRAWYGPLSSIG